MTVRQSETSRGCTCQEVLGLRTVLAIYEGTTGKTIEEIKRNIKQAIEFHIEGLKDDGLPIPTPTTESAFTRM